MGPYKRTQIAAHQCLLRGRRSRQAAVRDSGNKFQFPKIGSDNSRFSFIFYPSYTAAEAAIYIAAAVHEPQ